MARLAYPSEYALKDRVPVSSAYTQNSHGVYAGLVELTKAANIFFRRNWPPLGMKFPVNKRFHEGITSHEKAANL